VSLLSGSRNARGWKTRIGIATELKGGGAYYCRENILRLVVDSQFYLRWDTLQAEKKKRYYATRSEKIIRAHFPGKETAFLNIRGNIITKDKY